MRGMVGLGACPPPAPPRKILKIDAKILQFRGIPHITLLRYSSSACVNGKVLVGSDNHMHPDLGKSTTLSHLTPQMFMAKIMHCTVQVNLIVSTE